MTNPLYNPIYSSSPVVKEEVANLVEKVTVGQDFQVYFVPFKQKIITLRDTISTVSYWYNEKKLKEGQTFNDYKGYFNSFDSALENALYNIESYQIKKESELEIKIHVSVVEMAVLEDFTEAGKYWNKSTNSKRYQRLPENKVWYYHDEEIIKKYMETSLLVKQENDPDVAFEMRLKLLDLIEPLKVERKTLENTLSKTLEDNILIWSSKENSLESFNQLKEKYKVEPKS